MTRVAWWSPLPPLRSGIADHSYEVLEHLREHLDVVAVVDDRVPNVEAPDGVWVVGADLYRSGGVGPIDLDIYNMGNSATFHRYMHGAALARPGLLALHDPSLVDFYSDVCGGPTSPVFLAEARYNGLPAGEPVPTVLVDGRPTPDRLALLMSRRLAEASELTVVHSRWARDEIQRRFPNAWVAHVPLSAPVVDAPSVVRRPGDPVVFGVFGGLAWHKRVPVVVRAVADLHRERPGQVQLVIAGRNDDPSLVEAITTLVEESSLEDVVHLSADVSLASLEEAMARCDAVVALRWPTAGETSAIVMRAFGAGKPVMTTEVPQHWEFDRAFYWPVAVHPVDEAWGLRRLMREACDDPERLATAGKAARQFVEFNATPEVVAGRYIQLIEEVVERRRRPGALQPSGVAVNVFGDWEAATGLAEAGRRCVEALVTAGVGVSINTHENRFVPRSRHRLPPGLRVSASRRGGQIDLWYLNVNEMSIVPDSVLRPPGADGYVVASWFWELPRLAEHLEGQVDRVDEVWVGSRFVASAFRGHTAKPVHVMPVPVEPQPRSDLRRHDLRLPSGACLFLSSMDVNSTLARKNVWGVLRAFRRAFDAADRSGPVRLVVKTTHLDRTSPVGARLVEAVAELNGVLIDDELTRSEMDALVSLCDVYVSLHRSEGFGLGMAEAMALGRPVVATAYSGNIDFMTPANSCLVDFRLRPIEERDHADQPLGATVYEPGQLWAEPDTEHAARWMQQLGRSPALRRRIGEAGSATVRHRYSPAAAGAAMAARLQEIDRELVERRTGALGIEPA